jgi:hypothetical protein
MFKPILETLMKLLQTVLAALFVVVAAGCASPAMTPVPMVPYGAPSATSQSPWVTAAGCDALLARRMGKSC